MDRHTEARIVFGKGKQYAYLSYLGLVIPIVGIILGSMSLSTLKEIVATDQSDARELRSARRHARWGIGLSIAYITLVLLGWIIWSLTPATSSGVVNY